MPNQHAPDHKVLSFYIPRTLNALIRKAAAAQRKTITDFVEDTLTESVRSYDLTPTEYETIAKETREAERASAKRNAEKAGKRRIKSGSGSGKKVG